MSDKPTGGPAFGKFIKRGEVAISEGGLTVRDWFAGQALTFIQRASTDQQLAADAYEIADAMIAERDK